MLHYLLGLTSASYEILSSTRKIRQDIFWHNMNLKSLKIPASLIVIPYQTFVFMNSLQEFIVDEKNKYFKSIDGFLFGKKKQIFL